VQANVLFVLLAITVCHQASLHLKVVVKLAITALQELLYLILQLLIVKQVNTVQLDHLPLQPVQLVLINTRLTKVNALLVPKVTTVLLNLLTIGLISALLVTIVQMVLR
jgi:hypothetical protein